MGHEIVYCLLCQTQLRGTDFEKGQGYKIGVESVCKPCAPEATRTLPPEKIQALLKSMAAVAQGKAMPADPPKSGTGRIPHATPPPSRTVPAAPNSAGLVIGISIAAVVIVLAVAFSAKSTPSEAPTRAAPTPPPLVEIPATAPPPVEGAREAAARDALKKALAYVDSKPADLGGQLRLFDHALLEAKGTGVEKETRHAADAARRRIQEAVSQELLGLDDRIKTACLKEDFPGALDLVESARKRALTPDWSGDMDRRVQDVQSRADATFARVKEQARKASPVELAALKARVAKWGFDRFDLDRALAEATPAPAPPPTPAPAAATPEPPKVNAAAEAEAFQPKWNAALLHAYSRDLPAAIQELEKASADLKDPGNKALAAADLETLKAVAAFYAEALQTLGKWSPGRKITLTGHDFDFNVHKIEGPFVRLRDGCVEIGKGKPLSGLPLGNIQPRSFADFAGPRHRAAAAAACLLEGDTAGAKELLGDSGSAVPPRWWTWAEQAAARFVDPAQRKLDRDAGYVYYYATQGISWPAARAESAIACRKLLDEQGGSTAWVRRNKAFIAPIADLAKEFVFGPAALRSAGSFRLEMPKGAPPFWLSSLDTDASKRRENFIEAEFSTLPDTPYRAWAWIGGCCTEGLAFSIQGSEVPGADPGSDSDLPLKHGVSSVVKTHSGHPGRKGPSRWGWVEIALPKYSKPGAKSLRLVTNQQGLAVGWIVVSSLRDKPPVETELKDWDKDAQKGPGPLGPTLNLIAWYRADAGIVAEGGRVAQWQDQSGHGRPAIQANAPARPALVANGLNGHPALRFDGAMSTLSAECPINGFYAMTIFLVSSASKNLSGTELGTFAPMAWPESGPWGGVFLNPQQGLVSWRYGSPQWGNVNQWSRPAPGPSDKPTLSMVRKDAAREDLWVQGQPVHSVADKRSPITHTSETLTLGAGTDSRANPLKFFSGDIAEILIFSRAVSEAERDAIERYLRGKYGL